MKTHVLLAALLLALSHSPVFSHPWDMDTIQELTGGEFLR